MNQQPWVVALLIALGLVLTWFWIRDFRSRTAPSHPHPLPGATSCSSKLIVVGVMCGAALVIAETAGELCLGITHEQSTLTPLFAVWTILAAFCEEIIFRGHFAVQGKGNRILWASIIAFSAVFAALHPFVWKWDLDGFSWNPSLKGWFSTFFAFAGSIVFYALRFNRWNRSRSLLPCFAAHVSKNIGVIAIKALTG